MRIAVVAPSLEIVGGQGVEADVLIRSLRADGHQVTLVPINPRFPRGLGWLRRLPYLRTALNQLLFLPSLRRLRHADAVHVFSASYWSFLLGPLPALLAARSFGRRVLLNYHSGEADDHLVRWGALVHPWLRLADLLVVPSAYLEKVFARHGHRTTVIPNVLDLARFSYRERDPLRPRLLSTRNLEAHYAVDQTLRAFALLRLSYPDATLTIVGGGTQEGRLRHLAEVLGGGKVQFAGQVDPARMPAFYDEADVFVNSSLVDNQPLSVIEAFAAGLPLVSTAAGGIPEMVEHGSTGLIVPLANPAAMARAVASLLERPQQARLMARRARRQAERHTWPGARAAWTAAYAGGVA